MIVLTKENIMHQYGFRKGFLHASTAAKFF